MKLDYLELQKHFQSPILKPKTSSKILSVKNLKLQNPYSQLMLIDNTMWLREIGCLMKFLEESSLKVELMLNTTDKKSVQN